MSERIIKRKYTKEFKLEACKMVLEIGQQTKTTAENLGINSSMLGRWISEYKKNKNNSFPGNGKLNPEDLKMRELEKKLNRVTMERDILKKAMAYFVNQPK